MTKRILIAAGLMASLVSLTAHAERKYGRAGCGLGSMIIKPSGNQSSAALSNSTGEQTFGITSGTSNCTPGGKAGAEIRQQDFFVANFATLSKEIAQGRGDTVTAFAGTLGCGPAKTGAVAAQLKASYGEIFAAPGAVAAFDAAKDSLLGSPDLASQCAEL